MTRITSCLLSLALAFVGAVPVGAQTEQPAVARPVYTLGGNEHSGGTAFFIRVDSKVSYAAVGTHHGFELELLAQAPEVKFKLGGSGTTVAVSKGFLVQPGRTFSSPGATLRDDYNVYALESAPQGVRTLQISNRTDLTLGTRVHILGIPGSGQGDQTVVAGRLAELSLEHLEVDLDVPIDLRGWGGAPVVEASNERVIGILEANSPRGDAARVSIAPIGGVVAALDMAFEDGSRPFARFAGARLDEERASKASRQPPPATAGKLISQASAEGTSVQLQIDFPQDGETVSDSICGAYISGRAIAHQGELRNFDVVFVLDTSRSTVDPTGADINGNGIIGKPRLGQIGSIFDVGSTDPGDSILAAEVAAARQLLRGLDPRSTRVAVVRFAGEPPGASGGVFNRPPGRPAVTEQPLTNDFSRVEIALRNVLMNDPAGQTHIAAGVDQATIELTGMRGALSTEDPDSEKIVLFFTDGQPTLPYGPGFTADNVRAVFRAASRANRMGIRIHSFAIGPDALEGPIATVEMANRTNGYFTPVRHPGDLVEVVEEVSFANMKDIFVRNLTNETDANPLRMTADGSWGGFVKLEPGKNEISVAARADDGAEAKTTLTLLFEPDAPEATVPRGLVNQRNRLLEDCLIAVKRVRMEAEEDRNEQVRRELKMEIEKERDAARQRAEEQRKELKIIVDDSDEQEKQIQMDIDAADEQRQQIQMEVDEADRQNQQIQMDVDESDRQDQQIQMDVDEKDRKSP